MYEWVLAQPTTTPSEGGLDLTEDIVDICRLGALTQQIQPGTHVRKLPLCNSRWPRSTCVPE